MSINSSSLYPIISRYLELMRALGRRYRTEQGVLESLDRFLIAIGSSDLTQEAFTNWCQTQQHLTSGVLRARMNMVRKLCLYRRRSEPECFVPDSILFPIKHQSLIPYIFTEEEITRLIAAAQTVKPGSRSPLRAEVYRLAIVLLYTTGMRRGELTRLIINDYNVQDQTLLVRESKFHKSRYLPLSPNTSWEIEHYLQVRKHRHFMISAESPLLWNGYGKGYTGPGIREGIILLFRITDIHTRDGRLPRVHDIRHSFAVQALLRWYREHADLQAKLPLLSTYMGHVSIVSTQHYLHFVDELAVVSSTRFAKHYGLLINSYGEEL